MDLSHEAVETSVCSRGAGTEWARLGTARSGHVSWARQAEERYDIYDAAGRHLGYSTSDGRIYRRNGEYVGWVDFDNDV